MDSLENVNFEQAPADKVPRCPYCKEQLPVIWVKSDGLGLRGERTLLMCPHCESFLGFNAWKR